MRTKFFGDISINEDNIYYFKNGIPGFEGLKSFVLIKEDNQDDFFYLQSVTDENVCFITVTPWKMKDVYEIESTAEIEKELGYTESLEVYLVVCTHQDINKSTVNTQAPLLLNPDTKMGIQCILDNSKYNTRTPLAEMFN